MTHLLATVYSPPPNSMVSCESTQSMEKSSHLLPRLLAPAAWLHPHTGNSVLLRGCVVSCLHIFALLMSFAVWSSPRHSCDVMSCVPKARRLWCVLQKTSSGQIKFHSSKEWSSWLQSSVNKPIEYTEWGVSKQKNIQSRLCINWPISTDERLIRISAFFFLSISLFSDFVECVTTARSNYEKNLHILIVICVTNTMPGFPQKVIKTIWGTWKWFAV